MTPNVTALGSTSVGSAMGDTPFAGVLSLCLCFLDAETSEWGPPGSASHASGKHNAPPLSLLRPLPRADACTISQREEFRTPVGILSDTAIPGPVSPLVRFASIGHRFTVMRRSQSSPLILTVWQTQLPGYCCWETPNDRLESQLDRFGSIGNGGTVMYVRICSVIEPFT